MPLDFPSNPSNGTIYQDYIYSSSDKTWNTLRSKPNVSSRIGSLEEFKVNKAGSETIPAAITFSGSNVFNGTGSLSNATQTFNNDISYGPNVVGSSITYSKSMQLSTSAQTIFTRNDNIIPYDGTYLVKIETLSSYNNGGVSYWETYAGVMRWFTAYTNKDDIDGISLHRMGHAPNYETISMRTIRTFGNNGTHALQIYSTVNWSSPMTINFSFRRLI